jgi:hypothetical protein
MSRYTPMVGALAALLSATAAGAMPAEVRAVAPLQQGHGGGGGGQGKAHATAQHGGGQGHARAQEPRGGGRSAARPQQSGGEGRAARGSSGDHRPTASHGGGNGRASAERGAHATRAGGSDNANRGGGSNSRGAEMASSRSGTARGTGRHAERMFGAALDRGRRHGMASNALNTVNENGRVRITNRRGDVLLDMDDDRARNLGAWQLRRMGDRRPAGNAPAFCRSGAGHPVWGREWCVEKGFGLGSGAGTLWSRGNVTDVIFGRSYPTRLDRGGLLDVVGDIVFGRMALQAVTLGYDQPLMGVWLTPQNGPRILQVQSGGYPVAELVDVNRDDRVEVLYVIQPL